MLIQRKQELMGQLPCLAAQKGHAQVVDLLLRAGASKDKTSADEGTALFIAAFNGHAAVVELLLAAGADKEKARTDGATPLYGAVMKGQRQVVDLLLRAGADVMKSYNGITLLAIAERTHDACIVQLLSTAGCQ